MRFLFFFIFFLTNLYAYETSFLKISLPTDWTNNEQSFGAKAIFTSAIVANKEPLMLVYNEYDVSLKGKDIAKFIQTDLEREYKKQQIKNFKSETTQLNKKKELILVKADVIEDNKLQKVIVGIINQENRYHYFMAQVEEKDLAVIEKILGDIKLK